MITKDNKQEFWIDLNGRKIPKRNVYTPYGVVSDEAIEWVKQKIREVENSPKLYDERLEFLQNLLAAKKEVDSI